MDLEKRIEKLEKRVATLEELVQEQQEKQFSNDYGLDLGKPKLLKPKKKRLFNNCK